MRNRLTQITLITLALAGFGFGGCSAADTITDTIDCRQVCQRYADCYNADYNVDDCEDKCKSDADLSDNRQQHLRACDDCMDDKSCTSTAFNCTTECAGIF
jgi:hypothetical protein